MNRAAGIFGRREDERARDYSRAARERFVFHSTFIRADRDLLGSRFSMKFTFAPLGENIL